MPHFHFKSSAAKCDKLFFLFDYRLFLHSIPKPTHPETMTGYYPTVNAHHCAELPEPRGKGGGDPVSKKEQTLKILCGSMCQAALMPAVKVLITYRTAQFSLKTQWTIANKNICYSAALQYTRSCTWTQWGISSVSGKNHALFLSRCTSCFCQLCRPCLLIASYPAPDS